MTIQDYPDWSSPLQSVGAQARVPNDSDQATVKAGSVTLLSNPSGQDIYIYGWTVYCQPTETAGVVQLLRGSNAISEIWLSAGQVVE